MCSDKIKPFFRSILPFSFMYMVYPRLYLSLHLFRKFAIFPNHYALFIFGFYGLFIITRGHKNEMIDHMRSRSDLSNQKLKFKYYELKRIFPHLKSFFLVKSYFLYITFWIIFFFLIFHTHI